MIVVDTNVLSYLLIRGDRSEAMDRLLVKEPDWVAPRLWLDEFLNVLATYERRGTLCSEDVSSLLHDALELMHDRSYEVPPERVLAVARRTGCSALLDEQFRHFHRLLRGALEGHRSQGSRINRCPDR